MKKLLLILKLSGKAFITSVFLSLCPYAFAEGNEASNFLAEIWGHTSPTRVYATMITAHLNPKSSDDNWNNQLLAISSHGYFAGTLINSYDNRAYAAGIERSWFTHKISPHTEGNLGYRLGLITGYDGRMASFAENTPALPFVQVVYDIMWYDHFGIEAGWCAVIVSASLFYQF